MRPPRLKRTAGATDRFPADLAFDWVVDWSTGLKVSVSMRVDLRLVALAVVGLAEVRAPSPTRSTLSADPLGWLLEKWTVG